MLLIHHSESVISSLLWHNITYHWTFFQELIQYLKYTCPAHLYATSISPPAAQQIISSIKVVLGEDGSSRGRILTALWLLTEQCYVVAM